MLPCNASVDVAYCYGYHKWRGLSVCHSCVGHIDEMCKNGGTNQDTTCGTDSRGSGNLVLEVVQIHFGVLTPAGKSLI